MMQEDMKGQNNIFLEADVAPVINYALHQNGTRPIRSIVLTNSTEEELREIELRIVAEPEFCIPVTKTIDLLPPGDSLTIVDCGVKLNGMFLAGLTEKISGCLRISLMKGEEQLAGLDMEITALAFDQWNGYGSHPEFLTAFMTPNHPAIAALTSRAAAYMRQWGLGPSLDGYQTKDPNRVLNMAAAVYAAIQEQNIIYAMPPASFEISGQRVRLCDTVLNQKQGTCLDLTLLYTGCLEAMGLHPLLIVQQGHIFAGLWLEESTFPDSVTDDRSALTKRIAKGINEIAVVECTCMTEGKDCSFDQARSIAESELLEPIELIIDVRRARLTGITPLPQRIATEEGWTVVPTEKPAKKMGEAPASLEGTAVSDQPEQTGPIPKMVQWERKLLDLGLRNQLINLRLTKSTVPILTPSLDELENALADGREFGVMPRPQDWNVPRENLSFENIHELGEFAQVLRSEFSNGRLRSAYPEGELASVIKNLYRTAKLSLEENGANTLYLALGLLRWYETEKSTRARYAPVVLVPVEIIRKSAAKGYVIRLREDEAHMNITILEKIKQDFGISVSGLDPLPQDEHGIDIRKVMTTLRQAVMDQKRWDTLESACLGIFSFSQFVMWNDLRHRAEDLQRNKIVRSLMDGKLAWEGIDMSDTKSLEENEVFLPMSADGSQLFAIRAAAAGESFVLHGPPGSGKSQTITTLIANALANGQSLLFVAEKMAALEVVQKRLEKIGLGPFCLELHSNKAKKRDVLEQLRRVMEVARQGTSREFGEKAEEIAAMRRELDRYVQELHASQPCGKSLYELIGAYEAVCTAPEIPALKSEWVASLDGAALNRHRVLLGRLVSAGRCVSHPAGHPLTPVGTAVYSQRLRMSLPMVMNGYIDALEQLQMFFAQHQEKLPGTFRELENLYAVATELTKWEQWPVSWQDGEDLLPHLKGVKSYAAAGKRAEQLRQKLSSHWNEAFLDEDGKALLQQYNTAASKWFLPKLFEMKALMRRVAPYMKAPVQKENLLGALTLLCEYQQAREETKGLEGRYADGLDEVFAEGMIHWDQLETWVAEAMKSARCLQTELQADASLRRRVKRLGRDLITNWDRLMDARQEAIDLLMLSDGDGEDGWAAAQLRQCRLILQNADQLKEWVAWNAVALEARQEGLNSILDAYTEGLDHDLVLAAWQKAVSRELAIQGIDASQVLNHFAGTVFNEKIAHFARLDQEMELLTRREIFCRLASKLPNFPKEAAQSSEVGILQRAIRSGGRGLSLRKLFDQIPNLLARMCPCMLMSPISAAQYLDPKRAPFDLVVFDEASQLPTCKAVGALARGNNAVIVGDPKQMPPTTFFANQTVDEEHLEAEDLESILDDCLALNMPQTHLRWHYRSRHESLIAFSNSRFYEGRLLTFPSVNDRETKVSLVPVDGIFERNKNRQNRAEAEAVVEEIKRRFADENLRKFSVGVVTFNIHQQNLIDDLLTAACAADPELDRWVTESEEPLFIKNLENVQGDERDVILFSIGYGPDENGKVYMNFGPLNREGGWRRLNVAISRSRQEMIVFSTLKPEQIDLNRTDSEGVAALKAFLEYAAGKALSQNGTGGVTSIISRSGIADSLCKELTIKGYTTARNVGRSEYRIDVAVVDPEDPSRYMLGILLDGIGYRDCTLTRDRELAQISVLKGLGWRITRLWTMDWWDNSRKEVNRILTLLEQIHSGEVQPEEEKQPVSVSYTEETVVCSLSVRPYVATRLPGMDMTADQFLDDGNLMNTRVRIRAVVEQEAPIARDVLVRRVLRSCGISRAGERIQNHMTAMLDYMGLQKTNREGEGVFFWSPGQDSDAYMGIRCCGTGEDSRNAEDICTQELVNAVCIVLDDQISMSREDLVRESAKLLGYHRITDHIKCIMERAIEMAAAWGLLEPGKENSPVLTLKGTERAQLIRKVALAET